MNDLDTIIKSFNPLQNWEEFIKNNFDRKAGLYTSVEIKEFRIEFDNQKYFYPKRIIFENKYIKSKKTINKTERTLINGKKIKVVERIVQIPFGFYKRRNKYSGELINIIKDIFKSEKYEYCKYSENLLQLGDTPLFNIDSNVDWPSYVLYFSNINKNNKQIEQNDYFDTHQSILSEISREYGMHYSYSEKLKDIAFLIFKIPYIKLVENRIKKDKDKSEKLFFVLEYNDLSIFYTSKLNISAHIIIKDVKKETVYDDFVNIDFDKSKYQTLEVKPKIKCEIGFSSIDLYINKTLVDRSSGYYIRNIKVDVKLK